MFTHSVRFTVYLYDASGHQDSVTFYEDRVPFCYGWLKSLKDAFQHEYHEELCMLKYPEIRVCYEIDDFRFSVSRSDYRL